MGSFEQLVKQHVNDVNKKKVSSNALTEHTENLSHQIGWDNAMILENNGRTVLKTSLGIYPDSNDG